jgi:large subunit ribosomal protein L42
MTRYFAASTVLNKAPKTFEESPIQISVSNDGKTIVCWHPEQSFPYEHTKPLPKLETKYKTEDSVLKIQHREETDKVLHLKDYTVEELMQMTYTTRKNWDYSQDRFKKSHIKNPNPEIDRLGI